MGSRGGKASRDRVWYYVLLSVTAAIICLSLVIREYESFLVAVPTLVILLIALWRRGGVYLPPLLVILMSIMMLLLQLTRYGAREGYPISAIADFLMGVFLDLVGLIMVYAMLKASPGSETERPTFTAFDAVCIAITLSLGLVFGNYFLEGLIDGGPELDAGRFVPEMGTIALGAAFTSLLFYLNRHNGLFRHTLDKFLKENAEGLGIVERERETAEEEIGGGETSKVEFKSTLRTNIATGERDPRMEKAVLKTIVAFLNSKGGVLLIGVADDGTITGIDVSSFESRDKLNLHMNNLLTSQIGSEFLPYISYNLVDFGDGKYVMRVVCKRSEVPAFLIEGREKTFYVRSGPSSISLKGMDLLYYANHNFGRILRRPRDKSREGR